MITTVVTLAFALAVIATGYGNWFAAIGWTVAAIAGGFAANWYLMLSARERAGQ